MLTLYDYFRSSASFRVRIALNLKNLNYETIPIHLINNMGEQFSDTYTAINPQNLVPALKDEHKILTQSLAIIEYLDELYPIPTLLSNDPYKKALIKSFALAIVAEIHPLNNVRVLNYLTDTLNLSNQQKQEWYQHWIAKGFTALEKKLITSHFLGDFCFGDQPTMADICLVPQVYNAKRFACNLSAYPTLVRIATHCQQHPAFVTAWPMEKVENSKT